MTRPPVRIAFIVAAGLAACVWLVLAGPVLAKAPDVPGSAPLSRLAAVPAEPATAAPPAAPTPLEMLGAAYDSEADSGALGRSGRVFLRVLRADEAPAATHAGVYALQGRSSPAAVAVLAPFSRKFGAAVDGYDVGYWPGELRRVSSPAYENPEGFIVVMPETQDVQVSRHFRLGDFVTHDRQRATWPKVVVLQEALLDKLELVLADLEARGVATSHAVILSGFRTPAHNLALGEASGRARESRHQYGDGADLIIDVNRDGRMDDLNFDGRVDPADVRVIEAAVNRVERRYPELAGGLGLYRGEGAAGPFAHIDVRGNVARWDRTRPRTAPAARLAGGSVAKSGRVGSCSAPPQFAALCGRARR